MGLALAEANDLDRAQAVFDDLVERLKSYGVTDRQRVSALMGRARVLYQRQKFGEAIEANRDVRVWAWLATISEPDLGFGHYLLGLQRAGQGDNAGAAGELSRALALGLPGRDFVDNAARKLAIAAYRVGDVAGVDAAIAALSTADATTVDRWLAKDWRARLDFDKRFAK